MNNDPGSSNEREGQNLNADWLANTENGGAPIPEFKGKTVQAGEATPPAVNMDPAAQVDWTEQPAEIPKPYEPPMSKLSESVKVAEPIKTEEVDYSEKEKTPETGLNSDNNVYREIAKNALMNWNGLSEKEASEKASKESVDELEGQVYAKGSITAAIDGIDQALEYFDKDGLDDELKTALAEGVINGEKNDKCFKQLAEKLDVLKKWDHEGGVNSALFTLKALETIHDKWIEDNKAKFFDPKRVEKMYQFMPLQLIGSKEAKADLLFLEPILEAGGIEVNEELLDYGYNFQQKQFLHEQGVIHLLDSDEKIGRNGAMKLINNLAEDIISNTEKYYKGNDEISDALKNSSYDAFAISGQIGRQNHNDGIFAHYNKIKEKFEARDIEKAKSVTDLLLPEKRDAWNKYVDESKDMAYGTELPAQEAGLIRELDGNEKPDYEVAKWLFSKTTSAGSYYGVLEDVLKYSTNGPKFVEQMLENDDYLEKDPSVMQAWQELIKKHKEENARLLEKHKENNN